MSKDVVKAMERSLDHAANKYGWRASLKENQLNVVHDVDLFCSAMSFMEKEKVKADFQCFANISDGDFTDSGININVTIENHYNGDVDTVTING